MDSYTQKLEAVAADLYEHDLDKLPQIIASFRGHGAALGDFLNKHGFTGTNPEDVSDKAAFLKEKFELAGIGAGRARSALK